MLPIFTTQNEAAGPPAGTPAGAPMGKVELDLEGAPFLEPEPDDAPSPAQATIAQEVQVAPGAPPAKKSRKKLVIILGAALLGLIVVGVLLAYLFLFKSEPEPEKEAPPGVEVVVVPSVTPAPVPAPVDKYQISWDPFWVEVADPEGEIRFIYLKVTLVTDNQRVALQLEQKKTVIRDAVYYYLRHKPYSFLADLKQLDTLKGEMLNIVNYYILPEMVIPPGLQPGQGPPPGSPREKLKDLLIEDYLIK